MWFHMWLLKNFFPSQKIRRVRGFFSPAHLGYTAEVPTEENKDDQMVEEY